jgi:hypothetical protein
VGSELANSPDIQLLGPFAQAGELQVAEHAVTEFRHCDTLWWKQRKSSPNGRKPKGITRQNLSPLAPHTPHNLNNLRSSRGEAASSKFISTPRLKGGNDLFCPKRGSANK